MTIEEVITMIAEDLEALQAIIRKDVKYPEVSIEDIFSRVSNNYAVLQKARRSIVSIGDWIQLHVGGSEPVYAKVTAFYDNNTMVILSGMYNQTDATPNAFSLDLVLPVSLEVGRALEYANGNNKGRNVYGQSEKG